MLDTTTTTDRIEKTIDLRAPVARVWRALTDHEEFGTWFKARIDGPFVPGQVSTGRITSCGHEHMAWHAEVTAMQPESYFAFRWHPYAVDPDHDYSVEPMTLVEFRLTPIEGGTRVTVVESGFDALPVARRTEAFPLHEGGWVAQLRNVQAHVEH